MDAYCVIDPYDSRDWYSHSPDPSFFLGQCMEKQKLATCPSNGSAREQVYVKTSNEKDQLQAVRANTIFRGDFFFYMHTASTMDYLPLLWRIRGWRNTHFFSRKLNITTEYLIKKKEDRKI